MKFENMSDKEKKEYFLNCRKNKQAVINDRVYEFHLPKHKQALGFLNFLQQIENQSIDHEDKYYITKVSQLESLTVYDNSTIDKIPDYWEDRQGDYFEWLITFLSVIAIPYSNS